MQIENWTEDLRSAVKRRRAELTVSPPGSVFHDAAQATGDLPVYCDLGGCLTIAEDGTVRLFDLDSMTVREIESELEPWARVARIAASERYPEFAAIRPPRPSTAQDCQVCAGSGKVSVGSVPIRCGTCLGLGWV
jgi:hypothetical protein